MLPIVLFIIGLLIFPQTSWSWDIDLATKQPDIIYEGLEEGDYLGTSIAQGYVNDDEFKDLIISVIGGNGPENDRPGAGEVRIYYGQAGTPEYDTSRNPDVIIYGANAGDHLGYAIATGKINDDGKDDLIISAPFATGNNGVYSGLVYIIMGRDNFPSDKVDLRTFQADLVIHGRNKGDYLGCSVAAGNVNGKDSQDILVGSRYSNKYKGPNNSGAVFVIYGQSSYNDNTWDLGIGTPPADFVILGRNENDHLGCHISAGDVNGGDIKVDDIIVGAALANGPNNKPDSGEVYVIFGKESLEGILDLSVVSADVEIYGADAGDNLGLATAIGRINDDEIGDIIIGAPFGDGPPLNERIDAGEVYVIPGSTNLESKIDLYNPGSAVLTIIYGENSKDKIGSCRLNPNDPVYCGSVSSGDFSKDGFADILIGAPGAEGPNGGGSAYLILGKSSLPAVIDIASSSAEGVVHGAKSGDELGTAVFANYGSIFIGAHLTDKTNEPSENYGKVYGIYYDKDSDTYSPLGDSPDCNDMASKINPGASEECNDVDDNCDGKIDEGLLTTYYKDADEDTYGNPSNSIQACLKPTGYVENNNDCSDANASIHPGATEACNETDDDCDSVIDEGVKTTFYKDTDEDTYGNASDSTQTCLKPAGFVDNNTDCNDSSSSINLGASEVCNGIDDDCDGSTDEGVLSIYYKDADSDSYGDSSVNTQACNNPTGYVGNATDCNDSSASIHPGAAEVCNELDDNCDDSIDNECTSNDTQAPLPPASTSSEVAQSPDDNPEDTTGNTSGKGSNKKAGGGGGACFIATAAYGSYLDPHVVILRNFRDQVLLTNPMGRVLVDVYYMYSPSLADFIREHESIRTVTRWILTPVVYGIKYPEAVAVFIFLLSGGVFGTLADVFVKRKKTVRQDA